MKARLAIYNLNGKEARWWRDLEHTKKYALREIQWSKFRKTFLEEIHVGKVLRHKGEIFSQVTYGFHDYGFFY